MRIKELHHVCIQTVNYRESLHFYVELLGFRVIKDNDNFHSRDHCTWLEAANIRIELQTPKQGTTFNEWSKLNSGPVHICFLVDDIRQAYDSLKSKGYENFKVKHGSEVYEVEGSYLFKVRAPEGTEIEVRDDPALD